MPILFNLPGALCVGLGILLAFLIHPTGGKTTILIAGSIMAVSDIILRSVNKDADGNRSFFSPRRGGNIFFIPVWIIGFVVFVYSFFS